MYVRKHCNYLLILYCNMPHIVVLAIVALFDNSFGSPPPLTTNSFSNDFVTLALTPIEYQREHNIIQYDVYNCYYSKSYYYKSITDQGRRERWQLGPDRVQLSSCLRIINMVRANNLPK
jgi:hypothetical protein